MLELGKRVGTDAVNPFPPLLYKRFIVPAAQVLNAFSSPVTIIPVQPGYLILPERVHFHKPAGTAYGIAGVTNYGLSWSDGTSICLIAPAGVMDQTAAKSLVLQAPGSSVSAWTILGQFDLSLQFRCSGANPTLGTSDFIYWITFRLWPNAPLAWS